MFVAIFYSNTVKCVLYMTLHIILYREESNAENLLGGKKQRYGEGEI